MTKMKRNLILVFTVLILVALVLTACGKEDIERLLDEFGQELPTVEVTGMEGVEGDVQVNFVTSSEKQTAMTAVKDVYYVADGATTYAVDISIVKDGEKVEVGKPVTVSIELKEHALPLDKYVVFHVHDGKADQIIPRVDGDKLIITVDSFSPFIVVPKHEHSFGEWTFVGGEPACGEAGIQKRTCACGEEVTRDYTVDHVDANNDGKCDKCQASLNGESGTEGQTGGNGTVNPDGSVGGNGTVKPDDTTGEGGNGATGGHTHEFGAWEAVRKPTCTEPGLAERKCKCGYSETKILEAIGGSHVDKDGDGKCDKCQETISESGKPTGGESSGETGKPDDETSGGASGKPDGESGKPVDETGGGESGKPEGGEGSGESGAIEIPETYTKNGNVIYFGSYPQTQETDETIVRALNELAGGFPGRTGNDYGWTSYGYYHGTGDEHMNETTNEDDYMWYKDVEYNGVKYRGVYFIQYRPSLTVYQIGIDKSYSYKPTNTFQYNNGFRKTVAYWFRYEPVKWRILEEKNGSALVIADLIIDSQAYLNVAEYAGLDERSNSIHMNTNDGVPEGTYANNYKYSSIRSWLNDTFYNTAFTALQKSLIALTTVDNGITSSYPINGNDIEWNKGTKYLCADTLDYIFLPSEVEITSSKYGFHDFMERYANDKNRIRKYSDYALSQGLWAHGSAYTNDVLYGEYWLRSPRQENDGSGYGVACKVDEEGSAACGDFVIDTSIGVVPMLWIALAE